MGRWWLALVWLVLPAQAFGLRYDERARAKKAQQSVLVAARAALEKKSYDEALDGFERALRLRIAPELLLEVGALYEQKNDLGAARDAFFAYTTLAPREAAGFATAEAALTRLPAPKDARPGRFSLLVGAGRMVEIPAGEFLMGTNGFDEAERPQRTLSVSAFSIDVFEVTNQEYNRCVDEGVCRASALSDEPELASPRLPVVGVSWRDAATYCAWAGKRLPTEAEWEKAARGIDGRIFPWGDEADCTKANYGVVGTANYSCTGKNQGRVMPVGSFPEGASPFGVMDMAGNVQEWTADWFSVRAYDLPELTDPSGPATGEYRVVRGGGYSSPPSQVETTDRKFAVPETVGSLLGFRCARPAAPGFVPAAPASMSSDVEPTRPLP